VVEEVELNRLFWHSRRGMLELDVLLVPFVREVYPHLDEADRERYRKLLECEDQDMFGWFMQRSSVAAFSAATGLLCPDSGVGAAQSGAGGYAKLGALARRELLFRPRCLGSAKAFAVECAAGLSRAALHG
jgi:antitoxin CptB